jgi:hypothetical protein
MPFARLSDRLDAQQSQILSTISAAHPASQRIIINAAKPAVKVARESGEYTRMEKPKTNH